MADPIRPRFRYMLINTELGEVIGTDDQAEAEFVGSYEDQYVVIDAETQEKVVGSARSQITKP